MSAIAIIGMACRYPDAVSPSDLWANVLAQRRAFRKIPSERLRAEDYVSSEAHAADRTYSTEAAVLEGWEFDRTRFRVPGATFRSTDLVHWLALDVAADALADAGFEGGQGLDSEQTGVIVGNTLTGEFSRAQLLRLRWPYVRRAAAAALGNRGRSRGEITSVLKELEAEYKRPFEPIGEDTLAGALSNTIAGRVCNTFDFKGGGYTIDGACASSLLAVTSACAALSAGDLATALVGGVDLSLDPFELVGFAKAGALARGDMRVYDRRSDGFWPGEGCGFLVLVRLEDAIVAGTRVYSVIRGWGVSSDGRGGITRPELAGQLLALKRAYVRAGFGIDTVALFEGHGTGTEVGDRVELSALLQAREGTTHRAALGSIKANIGHTKAAAGVAGLIKAATSLHLQVIPPITGCIEPHELIAGSTLRIAREPEAWPASQPLRAGVSAFGFGGINSHVALEGVGRRSRRRKLPSSVVLVGASHQDAELFVLSAPDSAALSRQLERVAVAARAMSQAELADLASEMSRSAHIASPVRASLVAGSRLELEESLETLRAWLAEGRELFVDADRGLALCVGSPRARIGFLFPGQASPTYIEGGALVRRFGYVRALYRRAALVGEEDAFDTAVAQPAIVTASLAGLAVLRNVGVRGSIAVGHSLGELTALHWAGALDKWSVIELAAARGRSMADLAHEGAMMSIAAGPDCAQELLNGVVGICIAGLNGPSQTVVSGSASGIRQLGREAAKRGIGTTLLPVSHAFHSPLVAPAASAVAAHLADLGFYPLARRVASTVTGGILDRGADLAVLITNQITAPVQFSAALDAAASECDVLLEVGPGRILTSLASDLVSCPILALDAGGPSLRGLLGAVGVAFGLGHPVRLNALFDGRFTRPFDLDRPRRFLANPCESGEMPSEVPPPEIEPYEAPQPLDHEELHGADALTVIRSLVARRAELPESAVTDESTLIGDLHLSSIQVAEIASEAARALGVAPPVAPAEIAGATVSEFAAFMDGLEPASNEPEENVPGVAAWVRTFGVSFVEAPPLPPATKCRWHTIAPPDYPFAALLPEAFEGDDGEAGIALFLPPDPDERHAPFLLRAAHMVEEQDATRFALVQHGGGGASFAKTLHLERPSTHVCVIDIPADPKALQTARLEAEATNSFREVSYRDGKRLTPVIGLLEPAGTGDLPIGPDDVLLVTGGGKGIGAECALELAKASGARAALLGRSRPEDDEVLSENLERFRVAGVEHAYRCADVTDDRALCSAIAHFEEDFGPITALLHAAGNNVPRLLADLDEQTMREVISPKLGGLHAVLRGLDEDRLKLVVGFSSVIGRTGLRGEAHYALANEWLGRELERLDARLPSCRCLSLEWSVWSGVGMGERLGVIDGLSRAGVTPVSVDDGVEVLQRVLRSPELPVTLIASGRVGRPTTVKFNQQARQLLRFVDRVRVDVPGVELITDTELTQERDPYLCDHELDGALLVPGVISLEAIAQVATTLTGAPIRAMRSIEFARPITVPKDGGRTLRIAALVRSQSEVEVLLRSDETGFQVDHVRAVCELGVAEEEPMAIPIDAVPVVSDADFMYDKLLFQRGRFRRIRRYSSLHADRCIAEIEAREEFWFHTYLPDKLVLGDPGARDACLHALQACMPHDRVLPVGVDRIDFGRRPEGLIRLQAHERVRAAGTFVYDVDVADASGRLCERWQGVTLQKIASIETPSDWPSGLLVPYLERKLDELLGRRASISLLPSGRDRRSSNAALVQAGGQAIEPILRRPDGKPQAGPPFQLSAAHVHGTTLALVSRERFGCDIELVESRETGVWRDLLGPERLDLVQFLCTEDFEDFESGATRVWTAVECGRKVGQIGGPLTVSRIAPEGWMLLRSGESEVATYITRLEACERPVALAFLCKSTP